MRKAFLMRPVFLAGLLCLAGVPRLPASAGESAAAGGTILTVTGGKPLNGAVTLGGSKHSALNLLGALLLARGEVALDGFPVIADTSEMLRIYASFGLVSEMQGDRLVARLDESRLRFDASEMSRASNLRSSILLLGGALLRFGYVRFPAPGGDKIGDRPFDTEFEILDDFGIAHNPPGGLMIEARAPRPLSGDRTIDVRKSRSVSAVNPTALALILAAGNRGQTTLENVLQTREIVELEEFLAQLGVSVAGMGTEEVTLRSPGLNRLTTAAVKHRISPDKAELVFWIVAAAITRGTIDIRMITDEKLSLHQLGPAYRIYDSVLRPMGLRMLQAGATVFRVDGRELKLKPASLDVDYRGEFSGMIPDALPQLIPLLALAPGSSSYQDERYGNGRLGFYQELDRMGARITEASGSLEIHGVRGLHGADISGQDIRGAASLLLAALGAQGTSRLQGFEHIARAYEGIEGKLLNLGADLTDERSRGAAPYAAPRTP